jgi:nucleotide-binding universal stress UspA family protein
MAINSPMSEIAAVLEPRSVLIATDFSQPSEKALRHSLALARFYGSRFCLAHVVSSLGLTIAGPGAIAACEEVVLREAAQLEASLVRSGALTGIQYKFIVRQGELWPALREIIREESTDLLVVGTHGRHGVGKLFFGSVGEQIFRQAGCPVLILGPNSQQLPWVGSPSRARTFLFATDFGQASLHALSQSIAVANHFEAKLVFLNVIPAVPPRRSRLYAGTDPGKLQKNAYQIARQRLAELARSANLDVRPECRVEFESNRPISEWILETAEKLRASLIIMGLHSSAQFAVMSHLNWTTAYDVVCHAGSPVLTVNCASGRGHIGPKASQITTPPLSDTDRIRIRGLGVTW